MTASKVRAVVWVGLIIIIVVVILRVRTEKPSAPAVQLPPGISLAQALQSGDPGQPKGWDTTAVGQVQVDMSILSLRERAGLLLQEIRYRIGEWRGQSLLKIPNPPRYEYLPARLGECSQISGERYLLAGELLPTAYSSAQPFDRMLGFWYGGTNEVHHARDWISAIEAGILANGISVYRLLPPPHSREMPWTQSFLTNSCAIIRDTEGVVKILPVQCLRSYVDAGLVRLPDPKAGTP